MKSKAEGIKQFCLIQLQVLATREERLRKEILDCKIQREYLSQMAIELDETLIKADSSFIKLFKSDEGAAE